MKTWNGKCVLSDTCESRGRFCGCCGMLCILWGCLGDAFPFSSPSPFLFLSFSAPFPFLFFSFSSPFLFLFPLLFLSLSFFLSVSSHFPLLFLEEEQGGKERKRKGKGKGKERKRRGKGKEKERKRRGNRIGKREKKDKVGRHFGLFWETCGRHFGPFWATFGRQLGARKPVKT